MVVPDKDKLEDIAQRITQAKTSRTQRKKYLDDHHSQTQQGWRMVVELVTGLIIGFGIGYGIDVFFETAPFFIILFTLLGFAAGVRVMLKTAKEFEMSNHNTPEGRKDRGE